MFAEQTARPTSGEAVALPSGTLPVLVEREPIGKRMLFGAAVAFVVVLYFVALNQYWVAGHSGVDQNGYLLGAKQFARTWSMGMTTPDVYSFVGRMWIWAEDGTYFPKYPLGLPFLYALALWIGGANRGMELVYLVNPIAMALALVGTYLLLRQVVSAFPALLGMIVVASSPVTMALTNNPNSHATTLCAVVWGMYFLFRWWSEGKLNWARAAGFFVGYAATIRYTEGLLVIPLLLVALLNLKNRDPSPQPSPRMRGEGVSARLRAGGVLMLWWAIPIGILVTFNLCWFGHVTGYDPTNESTGFSWEYFRDNWETMICTLYNSGLFFVFPFAIAGLTSMFWWNWRVALVLTSWIFPSLLLYTAYYWAPDQPGGTSYIRFFLTILPPLALAAVWLMSRVIPAQQGHRSAHVASIVAAGIVVAIGGAVGVMSASGILEGEQSRSLSVKNAADHLMAKAPAGSFIFSESSLLHHLQFAGDYRVYAPEAFSKAWARSAERSTNDPDRPTPFQADRAKQLQALLKTESEFRLIKHQNFLMMLAGTTDHRVFFVGSRRQVEEMRRRFVTPGVFLSKIVDVWNDPGSPQPQRRGFDRFRSRGWNAGFWGMNSSTSTTEWVLMEITRRPAGSAASSESISTDSRGRERDRRR